MIDAGADYLHMDVMVCYVEGWMGKIGGNANTCFVGRVSNVFLLLKIFSSNCFVATLFPT